MDSGFGFSNIFYILILRQKRLTSNLNDKYLYNLLKRFNFERKVDEMRANFLDRIFLVF